MAYVNIGTLRGFMELEDGFTPGLQRAMGAVDAAEKRVKKFGEATSSLGRDLLPMSAALAAIGLGSVKLATDLNEHLANVSALLTDVADTDLDDVVSSMKTQVRGLAVEMGKSTGDIAGGLYEVVSSLGFTNDTFEQLEISAKAGAAGLATTQEAFNFLSAVTKTYGDTSGEAFKKVADLGFQAVNIGQTTFPELAAAIGGVAPIARVAGVSLEEMFAVLATATGVTGNTNEVVTQMASALNALLNPSKGMTSLFDKLGAASGEALIAEHGFVGALQLVAQHAAETGMPMLDLLGRKEAFILTASLAGDQATKFARDLELMGVAAGAQGGIVEGAFRRQTQGVNAAGFAWKQFKAEVQVAGEQLGDILTPILTRAWQAIKPLWEGVKQLIHAFGEAPQPIQTAVVALGALGAIAAPVLMALGPISTGLSALVGIGAKLLSWAAAAQKAVAASSILSSATSLLSTALSTLTGWLRPIGTTILSMVSSFTSWSGVTTLAGRAFTALRVGLAAFTGPLGWIVTAVTLAVPLFWKWIGGWDGIKAAALAVVPYLKTAWQFLKDLGTIIAFHVVDAFDTFVAWLGVAKTAIVGWVTGAVTWAGDKLRWLGDVILGFHASVGDALLWPFRAFFDLVQTHFPGVVSFITSNIEKIGAALKWLGGLWDGFASWLGTLWDGVRQRASDVINWVHRAAEGIRAGDRPDRPDLPGPPPMFSPAAGITAPAVPSGQVLQDIINQANRETAALAANQRRRTAISEQAQKAAEEHARAVQTLADRLGGAEAIKAADLWGEALVRIGGASRLSADQQKEYTRVVLEAVGALERAGRDVPRYWQVMANTARGDELLQGMRDYIGESASMFKFQTTTLLGLNAEGLIPTVKNTTDMAAAMMTAAPAVLYVTDNVSEMHAEIAKLARERRIEELHGLGQAFVSLGDAIGGTAGFVVAGVGGMTQAIADFQKHGAPEGAVANIAAMAQAAAATWEASRSGMVSGMMQGAMSGMQWGWQGAAAGAVAGGMMAAFNSGPSPEELREGREMASEFYEALAIQFDDVASGLDRLVAGHDQIARAGIVVRNVYDEMGLSATLASTHLQALENAQRRGPEAVAAAMDRINDLLQQHTQIMEDWSAGVDTFVGGFSQRVSGFADMMSRTGAATDEAAASFQRLQSYALTAFSVTLQQSNSAYTALLAIQEPLTQLLDLQTRFGFQTSASFERLADVSGIVIAHRDIFTSLEGLQLMMDGLSQATLLTHADLQLFGADAVSLFNELMLRGVDANTAMALMGPTLQSLWEHQQQYGAFTDAATLSLLSQAEAAGFVGEAQRDINQQILTAVLAVEGAILAVEAAILRLPEAFQNATFAAQQFAEYSRTPSDPSHYTGGSAVARPSAAPAVVVPAFSGGTQGRYVDFGAGTLAMLHGRERIMPASEGAGHGGAPTLNVTVNVTGGTIIGNSREFETTVGKALNKALQHNGEVLSEFAVITKQVVHR